MPLQILDAPGRCRKTYQPVFLFAPEQVEVGFRTSLRGRQRDAVEDPTVALRVIRALAGVGIQQTTGDVGERELLGAIVAQLV